MFGRPVEEKGTGDDDRVRDEDRAEGGRDILFGSLSSEVEEAGGAVS